MSWMKRKEKENKQTVISGDNKRKVLKGDVMNVRVEYDPTPIRHIAVQCPHCNKWFNGRDIVDGDWMDNLMYSYQIHFAKFTCPVCGLKFGGMCKEGDGADIEEASYPEIYDGCLEKKTVWE